MDAHPHLAVPQRCADERVEEEANCTGVSTEAGVAAGAGASKSRAGAGRGLADAV
jgi:hypothetical protein